MMLLDATGKPLRPEAEKAGLVKVTRSFSFKINLGNYENADFFCSETVECAPELAEGVSADVHDFCIEEVGKSIAEFKARQARKQAGRAA